MRLSGWPSSGLVHETFDCGCYLAPVGRGKCYGEPIDTMNYCQTPEATLATLAVIPAESNAGGKWAMKETKWRTSFSLAENKLEESVSPVQ